MEIKVNELFLDTGTAKIADIPKYIAAAHTAAGNGNEVIITGAAPVWLYLVIAHALHGVAKRLAYTSPVTGDIVIFDHNPE